MEITLVDNEISDREFTVKDGEELSLNLAVFSAFKAVKIHVKMGANAKFNGSFADFSKGEGPFQLTVDMLGEGSSCYWHLAALGGGDDRKTFDCSVNHKAQDTFAEMSNYGIATEHSKLLFTGVSDIAKGSSKSSTRQVAKIIVFDPHSDGVCSPKLLIGEADVQASHAASVGRFNDDELFYLESRGLDAASAKRLMVLGYLKPIEKYFSDPALAKRIDACIEEGI